MVTDKVITDRSMAQWCREKLMSSRRSCCSQRRRRHQRPKLHRNRARRRQQASIGCSMLHKPACSYPTEGLMHRTLCALWTYTANWAAIQQDWTERGRDRKGALRLGELLRGSLSDAAIHTNTHTHTHTHTQTAQVARSAHPILKKAENYQNIYSRVCVGGHRCRFPISKLVQCVDSLRSLSAANEFTQCVCAWVCVCVCLRRWSTPSRCANH